MLKLICSSASPTGPDESWYWPKRKRGDLNHNFIVTEHILLGLIHESDGVAAKALGSLGISLERVREKVGETIGAAGSATTRAPFTPRAKKVLEFSLREALQLGHNHIGTEHVLLGLVREGEGVAQVLVSLGADLSRVRQQVIQIVSGDRPPEAAGVAAVSTIEPRAGPRCPACRVMLDGHVGYRVLPVPPGDEADASEPIDVVFVYCLRCGVVIAHTPAGELGEPIVPRLVTRSPAPLQGARSKPSSTRPGAPAPGRSSSTLEEGALGAFAPGHGAEVVGVRYDRPDHAVVQLRSPGESASYFLSLFLHDDGWSMEAPAGRDRVVAEGVTADGVRWTLRAGGSEESYSTRLRTEDAAGVIDNGGMGGPKLWAPQRLNVYSGGNPDRGPRGVVVRCDPSIVRLVLVQEAGVEMDLAPCGDDVIDGLRFGLALVEPDVHLREIVGFDSGGLVVERMDLRGHDASWHSDR